MGRMRGLFSHLPHMHHEAHATPSPGIMDERNTPADKARLKAIEEEMKQNRGRNPNKGEARADVIPVKQAIELAKNDDYLKDPRLTKEQKTLVTAVKDELNTTAGPDYLAAAAKDDRWLVAVGYDKKGWEAVYQVDGIANSINVYTRDLSHGQVHSELRYGLAVAELSKIPAPEGLSQRDSYILAVAKAGEAHTQAYHEVPAEMVGKPLTPEQVVKERNKAISSTMVTDSAKANSGVHKKMSTEGTHVTKADLEMIYGANKVPATLEKMLVTKDTNTLKASAGRGPMPSQ